jgi:hypothetical protein
VARSNLRAATTNTANVVDPRVAPVLLELERWRARAVPDPAPPLDAEDIARLVRDCFASLGIDPAAAESFTVNTVHYYRRKDILDEPDGRTSAARYGVRHVWQAAGARLAGFLGLVTLAEARDEMRGSDESTLIRFVAARVADARGRQAVRSAPSEARPLRAASTASPALIVDAPSPITATVIPLGGNAMCLLPAAHAALRSPAAARSLVDALAAALGLES